MSRKEFLRNIGFMLLAAFGVTKFLEQWLKGDFIPEKTTKVASTTRWGGGKFGV